MRSRPDSTSSHRATSVDQPRSGLAPAAHPGGWLTSPLWLITDYIFSKIVATNIVIIAILAILATAIAISRLAGSLEDTFKEELVSAGRSASEAMVFLEHEQLALLRQMAYTIGVAPAVQETDRSKLQELLAPLAANADVPYVDVFGADGAYLLALRAERLGADGATRIDPLMRTWPPVQAVLQGQVDERGDKYADVVFAPWGALLVTAAPIYADGQRVGAVAIALPIEDVVARLSREAGSEGVSLYRRDGALVATVLRGARDILGPTLALPPDRLDTLARNRQVDIRRVSLDERPFVEVVGPLLLRREPVMLMGVGKLVTIIEEQGRQTTNTMLAVTMGALLLAVGIGLLLARSIARPLRRLVGATERVRHNDLDVALPAAGRDETGQLTVAFNEMVGGLQERERARVAIERYMSPRLYEKIQKEGLDRLGGDNREITVLMTDIRDFTALSERMPPRALLELLNRYFAAMFGPIERHDGEVDKYIGDGILAKFGATDWYPDHARKAVLCMIEMIEACDELNVELAREGLAALRMGAGGNTGLALVGNIGAPSRIEYTIISHAVNTAERVEALCREIGWDLLISDATYQQARAYIEVGRPWSVQLRGQTRRTLVYPVLGRRSAVPPARAERLAALLRERAARHQEPPAPSAAVATQ